HRRMASGELVVGAAADRTPARADAGGVRRALVWRARGGSRARGDEGCAGAVRRHARAGRGDRLYAPRGHAGRSRADAGGARDDHRASPAWVPAGPDQRLQRRCPGPLARDAVPRAVRRRDLFLLCWPAQAGSPHLPARLRATGDRAARRNVRRGRRQRRARRRRAGRYDGGLARAARRRARVERAADPLAPRVAAGLVPLDALALALGAAFLHALWNLMLARERDTEAATAVAVVSLVAVLVLPGAL